MMTIKNILITAAAVLGGVVALETLRRYHNADSAAGSSSANGPPAANVFSDTVDSIGAAITGNPNFSLGTAIFDATHPTVGEIDAQLADLSAPVHNQRNRAAKEAGLFGASPSGPVFAPQRNRAAKEAGLFGPSPSGLVTPPTSTVFDAYLGAMA